MRGCQHVAAADERPGARGNGAAAPCAAKGVGWVAGGRASGAEQAGIGPLYTHAFISHRESTGPLADKCMSCPALSGTWPLACVPPPPGPPTQHAGHSRILACLQWHSMGQEYLQ